MPPATDRSAAVPTITVRAPKGGRRRAGRRWPEGESTVAIATLTRGQLDALAGDPVLIVTHGQRLVGEAEAGAHPPVGTMERDDLGAGRRIGFGVTVDDATEAARPGTRARVAAIAADAMAPVPDSTVPGTQAAVSGAANPEGEPTEAEIAAAADEAVEAAIRKLGPDSFTAAGVPKIDAVRSMFGPGDREFATVEVRDRVWNRMTAEGARAPANSADEPRG